MSLLFESAIGDFDLSTATLYSPAGDDLEATRDEPVPIDGVVANRLETRSPAILWIPSSTNSSRSSERRWRPSAT